MRVVLCVALVVAVAVASFMVSAAWDHNPQYEFHGPGAEINWQGLGLIWGLWFAAVVTVLTAAGGAVVLLALGVEKWLSQRRST